MESIATLPTIIDTAWQLLFRGAVQKKDPLHSATIGTHLNGQVYLRTVILRQTDIAARQLCFYTDYRSDKVQQLNANPNISWLFYHPKKNIQISAKGMVTIHHQNELTLEKWKDLPTYGRKTYGTTLPPSTRLATDSDNLPSSWKAKTITLESTEYAYANFAVVTCKIQQLEWLHLQRSGHQRANFIFEDEIWKGEWMVP